MTDSPSDTTTPAVTDEEVAAFLRAHLAELGLPADHVGPESDLADLGLDSISIAGLLLTAREQLADEGRIPAEATLDELPPLTHVSDLGALLRSLAR